ncbi:MAG: nucleotidyltransferase [Firmicutes bacterium]|nr:nucleotidyltransferase [Bacillota bacterium]
MKAVIMAGGQGSRLRPLTCDLPKPMVPIVNYPVMEYIINLLKKHGVTEIAVTSYYMTKYIEDYFENGEKWGVNLKYFVEEEPLGTAGSVHNAVDFLDETFIVISGDAVTDFDLSEAVTFHQQKEADATLVLAREDIPLDYGVIMTDDGGEIIRFLEKPNWGQVFSDTINTGIYILEPSIFELYQKNKKYDFSQDLFPLMLKKGKRLFGAALEGYWNDIGSLDEYHQTQFDLLSGDIKLPLNACGVMDGDIYVEDRVEIDDTAELTGPLYIGKGSVIGQGVKLDNCVIGRNCRIESHSSIKKSVLWDNIIISPNVELRGTILANNVQVKNKAAIFDKTAVGKRTVIGRESRVKPGVKIWPEKEIADQTEVDSSIVWPTRWSKNVFSNKGIVGLSNIDITPEFTASIAVAYGSTLNKGDEVVVSSDSYSLSNALKRSLIGGLQAAGVDVIDIDDSTTSITRFAVVNLKASGGIHIRASYKESDKTVLEFLNEQGVNISVNEQKGIEKKFFSRDYNRVSIQEIGDYAYAPEMQKNYLDSLLANINREGIKRNYFSVVVDYEYDSLGNILPLFLKRLNCQLLSTRNFSPEHNTPLSIDKRLTASARVARIMQDNDSDLGIITDHNGEELYIVNKEAKVLSKAQYQVLLSYILFEKGYKYLPLPVNAPQVIESMAEEYGAEVEYTEINPQVAMEKYYSNLRGEHGDIEYYPFADMIAGLALILEKMAVDNISIDQLLNRLPEFYLNNAEIACQWEYKGKVMRRLSAEADDDAEMVDGIKFQHPHGWALVVPDSERPVFHVYAEGQDLEAAESLTGFYLDKVKEILGE